MDNAARGNYSSTRAITRDSTTTDDSNFLDIASCNLIIMISPPDNGVQLVQLIGIARQKHAKIFVLATSAEKAQWEKVKKEAEPQRRLLLLNNDDDIPN